MKIFKRWEFHLARPMLGFELFIKVIFCRTLRACRNVCAVGERRYPFEEGVHFSAASAKCSVFDKAAISGERAYPCTAADMAEVLSQKKTT